MLVSFDTSKAGQKRRLAGIATLNGQLTKFATQTMNL
jgi:hypothetical protein